MPVIAPRTAGVVVHALLDDSPLAFAAQNESVQVELKAVGDRIVVDTRGEATATDEGIAVEAKLVGKCPEFLGRATRMTSTSSTNVDSEFLRTRIQATLQGTQDGSRDSRRVPVHAHDAPERLKPEGITESREQFRTAIFTHHHLGDCCAQLGHALGKPGRDAPSMQGEIGGAGTTHAPILMNPGSRGRAGCGLAQRTKGRQITSDICHFRLVMICTSAPKRPKA